MLANNLVVAGKVNRQFENQFVKIGTTLTVRKPNRFKVTSGPGLSVQDIVEPSTSITISNQKHVDFQFSSGELSLTIEEFSERYLKPAAEELANQVDYDVISNYTSIFNLIGTPGVGPSTFAHLGAVGQRMDEGGVPQERTFVLNPSAYWALANGLSGTFVTAVSEPALKGYLAKIANFEIYMDQNIQQFTVGTLGGAGLVNSASQTGSTIVTNGWTPGVTNILNAGDCITLGSCNAVNPKNRQSTGALQNFVVTANCSSDAAGNLTIPIYPAITTSGAYQTVTQSPPAGAAVTVLTGATGTAYAQNIAFSRDCFGLVSVPLEMPDGVDFKAQQKYKNISLRILRVYDVNNDVWPCRSDILYGVTCFYPELGVRRTG